MVLKIKVRILRGLFCFLFCFELVIGNWDKGILFIFDINLDKLIDFLIVLLSFVIFLSRMLCVLSNVLMNNIIFLLVEVSRLSVYLVNKSVCN